MFFLELLNALFDTQVVVYRGESDINKPDNQEPTTFTGESTEFLEERSDGEGFNHTENGGTALCVMLRN